MTANIAENRRFYTEVLGLRLVKRSVNQDDVRAYHLFYADAAGSPGTDMTFFDWPTIGLNVAGTSSVGLTSFRVPGGSLDAWEQRLTEAGTAPERDTDEFGREVLLFSDPEAQRLELVDDTGLPGESTPWTSAVPAEMAVRGILGVFLESANPQGTAGVLSEILGYRHVKGSGGIFETSDERHFGQIRVNGPLGKRPARLGAGGVHHVAFRVEDDEELGALMDKIESKGLRTSGFVDRYYFHSVYFREPGGVLFELATDGPGFASDEDPAHLGERLALPPFLEPRRAEIEAGLRPID